MNKEINLYYIDKGNIQIINEENQKVLYNLYVKF